MRPAYGWMLLLVLAVAACSSDPSRDLKEKVLGPASVVCAPSTTNEQYARCLDVQYRQAFVAHEVGHLDLLALWSEKNIKYSQILDAQQIPVNDLRVAKYRIEVDYMLVGLVRDEIQSQEDAHRERWKFFYNMFDGLPGALDYHNCMKRHDEYVCAPFRQ